MLKPDLRIDMNWMYTLSYQLQNFGAVNSRGNVFSCRCPVCGDSKKNSKIKRFFFYQKKGVLNTDCKNCGYGRSFYNFIKEIFPSEFEQYKKEQMLERFNNKRTPEKKVVENVVEDHVQTSVDEISNVVPIVELDESHVARKYLIDRGFGYEQQVQLLYSENFVATARSLNPLSIDKDSKMREEPRIVIPFMTPDFKIEVIQGRAIGKSSLKYITIKAGDDVDKVYGRHSVDYSKTVYCVEGPLDSLFVDNCVATCDADLSKADADVYIWDNQPRSPEIIRYIDNAILDNKSVVIWPTSPIGKEDINDMILNGHTKESIMEIIKNRTFTGIRARLEFNRWRKA